MGNGPFLLELSDVLEQRKDARRLKRLWSNVIAKQKVNFWQTHTIGDGHAGTLKERIVGTLATVRDIMSRLGETREARRLGEEITRIEREERGKPLGKPVDRKMDKDCFWEIVEKAGAGASTSPERMERLTSELEAFKAVDIKKFDKLLQQKMAELYRWDIWALAYLAQDGCPDDAFEAFRAWLILQGRRVCDLALENVTELAAHVPSGLGALAEGLLYVPVLAYENRAGKPLVAAQAKPIQIQANRGKKWT